MLLEIWTDGTSRPKMFSKGNKKKDGHSACAIIVKQNNVILYKETFYSGIIDNNQAEYIAFIRAIKYALNSNNEHVCFYTDSDTIERQMNLKCSANKDSIIPYYNEAKENLQKLKSWEVKWIPRKENKEADKLANDFMEKWRIEHSIRDI